MKKMYNMDYMGGKCPLSYEFIESFKKNDGTYVNSYCRKIPKVRALDPDKANRNAIEKEKMKSWERALKIYFSKDDTFPTHEREI